MNFDLAAALKHQVVMLSGVEDALRRTAMEQLITAASGGDDFDLESFMADASEPAQWTASAGTAPFLSPRRTVVVRNLLRSDESAALVTGGLPESALLLLVADEELGDPDRQRKFEGNRRGWENSVKKNNGLVLSFTLNEAALKDLVRARAEEAGKKLPPRSAEILIEMSGGNVSRAIEELEKLVLFSGSNQQISESDVRAVVIPSREWNIFKLIDFIVAGNAAEALKQLRILVGSSTKADDAVYRSIFPNLAKQLRLLWQARICIDANTTPGAASAAVLRQFPDKPNLSKEADWSQRRAMQNAKSIRFEQLTALFNALSDAEAKLKGIGSSYNTFDTLEQMVLAMITHFRKQPAHR